MNVSLTPELEALVKAKVESGLYNNASEVIREALRMLYESERIRELKMEILKRELEAGAASLHNSGPSTESIDDIAARVLKNAETG